MRLPLDWILQEPIDMEHKEYVLLDYIKKITNDLDNFHLYPTFQELSIHLANLGSINKDMTKINLKTKPQSIDDEILLADIEYEKIKEFNRDNLKEIVKISKKSHEKLKDYFLIAKSVWSMVFESIMVEIDGEDMELTKKNTKKGYFYFQYKGETLIYKFKIKKLHPDFDEKKCEIKLLKSKDLTEKKEKNKLIFKITLSDDFPLEGCLLSIIKRKIMNYITQTVNLHDLKK